MRRTFRQSQPWWATCGMDLVSMHSKGKVPLDGGLPPPLGTNTNWRS